jgi:hypothetical protein
MSVDVPQALWTAAEEEARRHGHSLVGTEAGEQNLRTLIVIGAERMAKEGVVEEGPEMDQAIEHTREFVAVMADEVVRQNLDTFHEPTFWGAFSRLCPGLWPFC